jgi:hypothetical protein
MTNKRAPVRFTICVLFSLFFHGCILYLFLFSCWIPIHEKSKAAGALDFLSKEQILREAFRPFAHHRERMPPQKISSEEQMVCARSPVHEVDKHLVSLLLFQTQKWEEKLMSDVQLLVPLRPPSLAPEFLPLQLIIPTSPAPTPRTSQQLDQPDVHPETPFEAVRPFFSSEDAPPLVYEADLPLQNLADEELPQKASLSLPSSSMPLFPTLDELGTASYSDWFDLELTCTPRGDGKGYFFAATLVPRFDLNIPTMRQHYTFLIDRSNSIQKDRLMITKNAVFRALEELSPNDTFNMIAFDNKIEKLFPSAKKVDPLSLALAKNFLNKIDLGSFFSPADYLSPLMLTLPHHVEEDELHTAILLTDGESLMKRTVLTSVLQQWTQHSQGTVSLFAICMNSDLQQNVLNVATSLNRGWVLSASTKKGLKRKVLKLMKSIRMPLAKNLSCKVVSLSPNSTVELDPQPLQHLYLDQPFVILGRTENSESFILFVQGRLNDRWLNIKKKVSFINAKQGGAALKKEWALKNSYQCYERYLSDQNPVHLEKARALLADFDLIPILP